MWRCDYLVATNALGETTHGHGCIAVTRFGLLVHGMLQRHLSMWRAWSLKMGHLLMSIAYVNNYKEIFKLQYPKSKKSILVLRLLGYSIFAFWCISEHFVILHFWWISRHVCMLLLINGGRSIHIRLTFRLMFNFYEFLKIKIVLMFDSRASSTTTTRKT